MSTLAARAIAMAAAGATTVTPAARRGGTRRFAHAAAPLTLTHQRALAAACRPALLRELTPASSSLGDAWLLRVGITSGGIAGTTRLLPQALRSGTRRYASTGPASKLGAVVSPPGDSDRQARLRAVFDTLCGGAGNSDALTVELLKSAVRRELPEATVDDDAVRSMVRVADTSADGCVSFHEFEVLFDGIPDAEISVTALAEEWLHSSDLQDPEIVFSSAWRKLRAVRGGDESIRFPSEFLWLGGAPGSGKGTNTPFILRERGISAPPIVISDLLTSPAALRVKADGGLVSDAEVFEYLMLELTEDKYKHGALIDGFPRTKAQVVMLHLLYDKLLRQQQLFENTALAAQFPRPKFRVVVLYVDEVSHTAAVGPGKRGDGTRWHAMHRFGRGRRCACHDCHTDVVCPRV